MSETGIWIAWGLPTPGRELQALAALRDALGNQLGDAPSIGRALARDWGKAAQDFDSIMAGGKAAHHAGESLEQLEARALLYRFYVRLGMMPKAGRG